MRLHLELDDFRFATTVDGQFGHVRWIIVRIGEKDFCVRREFDPGPLRNKLRDDYVDRFLIDQMRAMLEKVFLDACAAVPEGVDLIEKQRLEREKNAL